MGFDQYHEPADELSPETRTFARMIASLKEECEAIGWYQQRISIEQDADAKKIMEHAQEEEFLHFSMDLEFLLRHTPKWRVAAQHVLFHEGDIIENAEKGESAEEKLDYLCMADLSSVSEGVACIGFQGDRKGSPLHIVIRVGEAIPGNVGAIPIGANLRIVGFF